MTTQAAPKEDPLVVYRRKFVEASKAGDIEVIISLVADDAVIMSPNDSTLYGKAEYKEWLEEYVQYFRVIAFNEPERSVTINGDFATEWTTYMLAVQPLGGASRIRDDGRFLTIWKRQPGGEWKIWQMMWNSTKPIGIGTNRYMWRSMQKKKRMKR